MARRILAALAAFLGLITVGVPALAGNIVQIDSAWPPAMADASPCWTVRVRNAHTYAPDTAPETLRLYRQGYDANANPASYTDDIVLTQRVRQTWQGLAASMVNLFGDRVALSEPVYRTDTPADGVKNYCTEHSPKPIAGWWTLQRRVVGDTVGGSGDPIEIVVGHANARSNREAAAVKWIWSDGVNTPVTAITSSTVVSGRAGDRHAQIVFQMPSMDISSLNTGLVTLNAEVYPWIGAAASVAKSADSAVEREFSPRYYLHNATKAASPPIAYVCANAGTGDVCTASGGSSAGNDTNGCWSTTAATAAATPFATVQGAINGAASATCSNSTTTGGVVDGGIVRIGLAGTYTLASAATTRTQNVACVSVDRDSSITRANAVVAFGTTQYRPKLGGSLTSPVVTGCLRFHDVKISRTGTQGIGNAADTTLELQWDDVDFDNGSNSATWLVNANDYMTGVTFTNLTGGSALGAGTPEHRLMRGISVDINGGNIEGWWLGGSDITRPGQITANTRTASGTIIHGVFIAQPAGSTVFAPGASENISHIAILQNVCEWTTATSGHCLSATNDSYTGSNNHFVNHMNTTAGFFTSGRQNGPYDEGATPRQTKFWSQRGNIIVALFTKGDWVRGAVEAGADAPYRVGNYAFTYGVGLQGNLIQWVDTPNGGIGGDRQLTYPGLGAKVGTSSTTTTMDPLFTSNQAATWSGSGTTVTAGAGGGTYSVSGSSPAKNIVTQPPLAFDYAGNARGATTTCAGAYEC